MEEPLAFGRAFGAEPVFPCRFQQHESAKDILLDEIPGAEYRAVYMAFSREIHDSIYAFFCEEAIDKARVVYVAPHEPVIFPFTEGLQIFEVPGIGELVEHHEPCLRRGLRQMEDEVAADEPGPSGYEDLAHFNSP